MDYRKVVGLNLTGSLQRESFSAWFNQLNRRPDELRLSIDGHSVGFGFKDWTIEEKEQIVKEAFYHQLPVEIILKNKEGEESYRLPIEEGGHVFFNHREDASEMYIKLNDKRMSLYVKDVQMDHFVFWIFNLLETVGEHLQRYSTKTKRETYQRLIDRANELRRDTGSRDSKLSKIEQMSRKDRRKDVKLGIEKASTDFVLFTIPDDSEKIPSTGIVGSGDFRSFSYVILILFVLLEESSVLQAYVLQCFKKELKAC